MSHCTTFTTYTTATTLFHKQVLLLIILCIGGSLVMRKYRTSLAVGFFLGVVTIMSQQMLILFAVFAGRAGDTPAQYVLQILKKKKVAIFDYIYNTD
jgi:hypothetical protein